MKHHLSGVAMAAALVALAVPAAWAQTGAQTPSNQQTAPGTGGVSKPGAAGLPGNKSGPAVRDPKGSSGTSSSPSAITSGSGTTSGPASSNPGPASTSNTSQQDQSKVPGMAGNKSGPSVREPGSGASSGTSGNPSSPSK